ncbi:MULTISPECIES: PAS domain S-box protein [unclassified Aureimonas]|uniref:PAS domain-containing sensor histidine kinase n=1 Tax=unclassified Aureimonas TaxID=2615206 RepID=UPI0006F4840F|nr:MULTISPECIES: PAS domain S-box protein [unclassified Aureimonas]KQT55199.1 hypothetical protein ASG62_10185 [Aureimonas sp. Leaf427]KQT70989.1 hypothetical protein ASG54_20570 [Aureimonas sp. Leaf460]
MIAQSVGDAIIGETLDGVVTDWNSGAESIFGYTAAEAAGRHISFLFPEDAKSEPDTILNRIRLGERVELHIAKRRRKDGRLIDVSLTDSPVYDGAGRLVGAAKVARDVTDFMGSQARLEASEARLRSVLDTVPEAMILIDEGGVIESFSATAEVLFGYTAEEAIGRNVSTLMPVPHGERHDGYILRYLATGERRIIGIGRKVEGLRRNGSTFPMQLTVGELRAGGRRYFTGFVQDLTEHDEAQRRLGQLQDELVHMSRLTALGEMATTLAHELNQPLTATANYLNGARRLLANVTPERLDMVREAIEQAAGQVLRGGEIIRRLREFVARGETNRQPEDLQTLVQEACALGLVGAGESGVEIRYNLDPKADVVLADRVQIQQVLLNLVRNGIEAMQDVPFKRLTVGTRRIDRATVEVSVADTGTGIVPEIAAKLFQPFVTSKTRGLGVGLSISRTIVEAHGGHLWAEPVATGGTTFRMTLVTVQDGEGDDGK